ncbi:MAG: ABC transporter ATP-binding protein [Solirubrobacterales bacterium]|nr:ABC transporter ATP-binding protein [Solirubrobacterales bacterium]MBV9535954.1 ABC transporter ATP-binding protein [Solirubrobacterales bacterium]
MANDNKAQHEGPSVYAQARPGAGQQAATLELRDVTKVYPQQPRPALANLSLKVGAGEVCVLVGPSGSGKTTAMRLINRMIPLSGGDILIGDRSVLKRDPVKLRREIGYVIQQIGLFPHLTVAENIATVPRLLGWNRARTGARVGELLRLIGLEPEIGKRYPAQLSGGQRQRVGVARALAGDPPVLLMDEPFGAIDPINRNRLQDEFQRLQQGLRKTVVFVTHDIDEAIKLGDRIAILREGGTLAQYDTPAELLTRPGDEFVAQFVGADRALKRLGLQTLAEIELLDAHGIDVGDRRVPLTTTLRDALSRVLDAGGAPLAVVDGAETVGAVTLELLGGLLHDGALGERASGESAVR